jgi:hypothetical protein
VPQIPEFGYDMGMGQNFMDPFLLFDGLDGLGGNPINDWSEGANMDLGAEGLPNTQDWNFG